MEKPGAGYESRIVDGRIAYWRFLPSAEQVAFNDAFEEFVRLVRRPEIDRLMVEIESTTVPWGQTIQDLWLKTGEIAEGAGIVRWGVVAPKDLKRLLIQYLVSGGEQPERRYEHYIGESYDDVLSWLRG